MAAFDFAPGESEISETAHESAIAVAASSPAPAQLSAELTATSWRIWLLVPLMFVMAATGTFSGFYLHGSASARLNRDNVLASAAALPRLSMRVETRADRLLVSWDPQPLSRTAKYGILSIHDGSQQHEIDLAAAELSNGSILYKPASNDLTFRLEVHGPGMPLITGIVRTFDGSAPVPTIVEAKSTPNRTAETRSPSALSQPQHELARSTRSRTPSLSTNRMKPIAMTRTAVLPEIPLEAVQAAGSLPSSFAPPQAPDFASKQISPPASKLAHPQQTPSINKAPAPQTSALSPVFRNADVKTSSIYRPPKPVRQVMPNIRSFASSAVTEPTQIDVEIKIDEKGRVVSAHVPKTRMNPGGPLLMQQVIAAARQWGFEPAKLHGEPVPSDYVIRFSFHPGP
ncbi:MAG: energy transducer TonB [Acidobacteriaceae bacterium]|nr:energy transducer TonB [Acidobacteriaceae bacterium]MBV9778459.1 energy transducer TonB [Acidobacteriaceae bacterium]